MARINYETVEKMVLAQHKKMSELYSYVGYSRQSNTNFKKQGYIPVKFVSKISEFLNVDVSRILEVTSEEPDNVKVEVREIMIESTEMEPIIKNGSKVFCVKQEISDLEENSIVYFQYKTFIGLRRIKFDKVFKKIVLVPDNILNHEVIIVEQEDIECLQVFKVKNYSYSIV